MEGTASITSRQHERELIGRAEEAIGAARDELRGGIEGGKLKIPRRVEVVLEDGTYAFGGHYFGYRRDEPPEAPRWGGSKVDVSPDGTITHDVPDAATQAVIDEQLAAGGRYTINLEPVGGDRSLVCIIIEDGDGGEEFVPYRVEHVAYRMPDGRALKLDDLAAALAEQDARRRGDVELADAISRAGSAPAEDVYPLPTVAQDYLHGSYVTRRNENTRATYRRALRSYARWLHIDKGLELEEAGTEDETDWLQWLADEGRARATLRTYDAAVRSFYEWCSENLVCFVELGGERRAELLGISQRGGEPADGLKEANQDRLPVKKHMRPKSKVDKEIFGEPCDGLGWIEPGRLASIDMAGEDEPRDVSTLVKLTYDAEGIFYFTPEGTRVGSDRLNMDDRSTCDAVASLWCAGIRHFSARQVLETRGVANPSREREAEELRHLEWLSHWVVDINWKAELRDGGSGETGGIRPLLDIWPEYYRYTSPNGGTKSIYGFEVLSKPILLAHAASTGQLAIWDQESYLAALEDVRSSSLMQDIEEYMSERITSMGREGANNNTIRVDRTRGKMLEKYPKATMRTVAKDMRAIANGYVSKSFSYTKKVGASYREFYVAGMRENLKGRSTESFTFDIKQRRKPK